MVHKASSVSPEASQAEIGDQQRPVPATVQTSPSSTTENPKEHDADRDDSGRHSSLSILRDARINRIDPGLKSDRCLAPTGSPTNQNNTQQNLSAKVSPSKSSVTKKVTFAVEPISLPPAPFSLENELRRDGEEESVTTSGESDETIARATVELESEWSTCNFREHCWGDGRQYSADRVARSRET